MVSFENLTLHYLDVGNHGRAGGIRFLLHDADVNFRDNRFSFDEWAKVKPSFIEKYPTAVLPAIETADGQFFGATVPVMRLLGKELGYIPNNLKDASFVEEAADLASHFLQDYISQLYQPHQNHYHRTVEMRLHLERFERILGAHSDGPYIMGKQISFADFLLFDTLRQEEILDKLESSPNLAAFVKGVRERPNIKSYLATFPEKEPELVLNTGK